MPTSHYLLVKAREPFTSVTGNDGQRQRQNVSIYKKVLSTLRKDEDLFNNLVQFGPLSVVGRIFRKVHRNNEELLIQSNWKSFADV